MNGFKTFFLMDIFDEGFDAALVMKDFASYVFFVAFIGEDDFYAGIEECLFTKTDKKGIVFIFKGFENLSVRLEKNFGSFFVCIADDFKVTIRNAAVKTLAVDMFAVFYANFQPFGKGVNNGCAYAMKTAGNFIAAAAEFTACMENGENNGYRRDSEFCMDTYGDSSAVIGYTDEISRKEFDVDIGAVSCQCFVDGVIHYFVNKVMKTLGTGGTDIHTGSFSYCFKSFKDLDLVFVVGFLHGFYGKRSIFHNLPPKYLSAFYCGGFRFFAFSLRRRCRITVWLRRMRWNLNTSSVFRLSAKSSFPSRGSLYSVPLRFLRVVGASWDIYTFSFPFSLVTQKLFGRS